MTFLSFVNFKRLSKQIVFIESLCKYIVLIQLLLLFNFFAFKKRVKIYTKKDITYGNLFNIFDTNDVNVSVTFV